MNDKGVQQLAKELGLDTTDPLLRVLKHQAGLGEKVERWTETNLEILRLLNDKTKVTEQLSQNLAQLSNTYKALETRLQTLEEQIQASNRIWTQVGAEVEHSIEVQKHWSLKLKKLFLPINHLSKMNLERRDWIWIINFVANITTVVTIITFALLSQR